MTDELRWRGDDGLVHRSFVEYFKNPPGSGNYFRRTLCGRVVRVASRLHTVNAVKKEKGPVSCFACMTQDEPTYVMQQQIDDATNRMIHGTGVPLKYFGAWRR